MTTLSLDLESADGAPLAHPLAGQFITLKLEPRGGVPPLVRSYSLSGPPDSDRYRITVKVEPHGAAGTYLRDMADVGDEIKVAAPRGRFTLDDSARPVVLVSAGVGVTPVLAMLHALHDRQSTREIWWLHGTRNGDEHAFAQETRSLLATLANAHSRVWYSQPGPDDRLGTDYDEPGHLTPEGISAAAAPVDGEFYVCGPTPFMSAMRCGLQALGVPADRVHSEAFGAEAPITPGIVSGPVRPPHPPAGAPGTGPIVSFVRTGLNVRWDDTYASILSSPRRATCPFVGRVALVCAIPARPASWRAR